MEAKEMKQECICSLGLAEECPAHPNRQKRVREKPNAGEIRAADCAACKVIGVREHEYLRHRLGGYNEVSKALTLGTVYVSLEKYDNRPMVVRDAQASPSFQLLVLEGWQTGPFTEIWMEAKRPAWAKAS